MTRSRVNQRLVKQTERNLILIVIGIIIVLMILLFVGVKLLVNFSLLVEKKSDTSDTSTSNEIIVPPVLDPLDTATNSASIDISGTAGSGKYVVLFINGKQVKKADVKSDSTFVFHDAPLKQGSNEITAKAYIDANKSSKNSSSETIIYSNKAPSLTVDFPSDNETYHKENNPLKVRGKTDPNVRVTVNDFWALVDDSGNYSYSLPLKGGDNQIKVVATDDAGNKTEKSLKINYSE